MSVINQIKNPYGLGGGVYLSGAANASADYYFVYYPLEDSDATLKMREMVNGSTITRTFTAGIPVYGTIYEVTQSSGASIVYKAIRDTEDPAV